MGLIRLLLALSVVVTHANERAADGFAQEGFLGLHWVAGQSAVQAFYVISGFYMALVLNRKYPRGAAGYRTFITARVLRLFPAYYFVLLLTILLAATQLVPHPALARWRSDASTMSPAAMALMGGSQLTLIGQDAVWFSEYEVSTGKIEFRAHPAVVAYNRAPGPDAPTPAVPPNATQPTTAAMQAEAPELPPDVRPGLDYLFVGQAWTLGVELLFYCCAPFIVRSMGRIGFFFCLSWAIRLALAHYGMRDNPWSYRFFPNELATFLCGSAGYHLYARLSPQTLRSVGRFAWPAILLVVMFLFQFERLPLRGLIMIFGMAAAVPFVFALTKDWHLDRWIGELSYPVYICHETVRLAIAHYSPSGHALVNVVVPITLAASILLMLGVEQPFERLRARFVARRKAALSEPATATATPSAQA